MCDDEVAADRIGGDDVLPTCHASNARMATIEGSRLISRTHDCPDVAAHHINRSAETGQRGLAKCDDVDIADHRPGASSGRLQREGLSDPGRAAGDDGDRAGEGGCWCGIWVGHTVAATGTSSL